MATHSGHWIGGNTLTGRSLSTRTTSGRSERRRGQGPQTPLGRLLGLLPRIGPAVALIGLLLAVFAGLGYRWGWWELRAVAFVMLRYGAVIALVGAALSLIGAAVSWPGRGRPGFGLALAGLALGTVTFVVPYHQLRVVYSLPFIHDITTDTENPPAFVALAELKAGTENGVEYGGPEVADQQRAAYPDVQPLEFDAEPEIVFGEAVTAARSLGWELADVSPVDGRIEATDTTFWFGFKDDVVIRVQAVQPPGEDGGAEAATAPAGDDGAAEAAAPRTRVDIRSLSRVGKSDVGVNARRIRDFRRALTELVAATD